jgi:hypothetical protein
MAVSNAEKAKAYRERYPERAWDSQYRYKYGITYEEYERLFAEQGGRCAICGDTPERRLYVDHDHSCCPGYKACGTCVRGLLCERCNKGLGFFRDNIEALRTAIKYLGGD